MNKKLRSITIAAALLMSFLPVTVSARSMDSDNSTGDTNFDQGQVCVPPGDWEDTVRLFHRDRPSKTWEFEVEEPLMDVVLEFFYYQDYDRFGCPFDCDGKDCQGEEIGNGETPLGSFEISDGVLGPHEGQRTLTGRLAQGSYSASFWVTGRGSINIGLRVKKTPVVQETPTSEATMTPTATTELTNTPIPTETPADSTTPTLTATVMTPTATETPLVFPPVETLTPTSPAATPTVSDSTPETEATPTPTEVNTLPPPAAPPSLTKTPAIIPVTGADLSQANSASGFDGQLLRNLVIGLLGLGLFVHGMGMRRSG